MKTKVSVECWVIDPSEQVLLLQVPGRPGEHEAFWQPVTGGIEDGESPSRAALREIAEETGLSLAPSDLDQIYDGFTVVISPGLTISKTIYVARTDGTDITTNPREHTDHRWLPPDEIPAALFWPSNRETWRLVSQSRAPAAIDGDA